MNNHLTKTFLSSTKPNQVLVGSIQNHYYHAFTTKPIPIEHLDHTFHDDNVDETDSNYDTILLSGAQRKFATALKPYHDEQKPVLIRNFYNNNNNEKHNHPLTIPCRALQHWTDLDYLKNTIGSNTRVFVEIGGSYNQSNISRSEIEFGDYISYIKLFHDQYGPTSAHCSNDGKDGHNDDSHRPKKEEIVYMAQNDVNSFHSHGIQCDFIIPQLCHDAKHEVGNGQMYNTMFWFGPKYCVSPLHYDPLDNLLMQFVGRKRVVLFPKDNNNIRKNLHGCNDNWNYAGVNGQQYNTSPIDIMNVDFEKYPKFRNAPVASNCILHPGDVLFIPHRWWHYVESFDTAISVNVWWR